MKVYELLNSPDKWTQKAYARDKNGNVVQARDVEAVCWCIRGAVIKCYGNPYDAFSKFSSVMADYHLVKWNDEETRKYEDIIQLCKEVDI